MFWADDTKEARKRLWIGMLMVLATIIILCLWAIIYITTFYEYDYVYLGSGPMEEKSIRGTKYSNYMDEEKGGYILSECFWALLEGGFYLYFFFVTYKYEETYYIEEPEEEKKSEKSGEKEKEEG